VGFRKDTTYNSCWIISIVGVTSYHPTSAAPLQVFGRDSQNRFRKYLLGLENIGHRNSEFSHEKWWFPRVFCKRLPEGKATGFLINISQIDKQLLVPSLGGKMVKVPSEKAGCPSSSSRQNLQRWKTTALQHFSNQPAAPLLLDIPNTSNQRSWVISKSLGLWSLHIYQSLLDVCLTTAPESTSILTMKGLLDMALHKHRIPQIQLFSRWKLSSKTKKQRSFEEECCRSNQSKSPILPERGVLHTPNGRFIGFTTSTPSVWRQSIRTMQLFGLQGLALQLRVGFQAPFNCSYIPHKPFVNRLVSTNVGKRWHHLVPKLWWTIAKWLIGGWPTPLKNIGQLGWWHSQYYYGNNIMINQYNLDHFGITLPYLNYYSQYLEK